MDTPNSKGRSVFWEAYRGCAEENRGASDRLPLAHANVIPTMIYTHVLNEPGLSVKSPADI
jgi:hypothetical protein